MHIHTKGHTLNYSNAYDTIISKAVNDTGRKKGGSVYYESHHIVPRALGGTNEVSNLVLLTAKEHFVCHHLLHKMHGGVMTYAFALMCKSNTHHSRFRPNARTVAKSKEALSKLQKGRWTGLKNPNHNRDVTGANNPMYGTSRTGESNPFFGKRHTDNTKAQISMAKKGQGAGLKNPNSRGLIHTPYGIFESCALAGLAEGKDQSTIWKRLKKDTFPEYYLIKVQLD